MKADPIAFKRATNVSLLGLTLQIVLALVFLLYSVFGQDQAALTAFYYVALGAPVWLGLALVFNQHRLERLEAAEAEMFASSSASQASVFAEVDTELRVQSRRLSWMHRVLLPVLSLGVGGALIGLGLVQFLDDRAFLSPTTSLTGRLTGWAVSLGLGAAVIAFIFARFVAGMAKQPAWSNLRAGASVMVGASLVGLAIAVAHGADFAGSNLALRYLHVVLPIFMIALGAEVFLNFVLNIYRPRRAGEIPRPAFDSRVLGFVAAPDRLVESISDAINYQFGFEVSSTWFYRLLSRSIASLLLLAGLTIWLLSAFPVVEADERGLLLSWGRLSREVGPGLHVKAPWPFQSIQRFPATAVRQLEVGTPPPSGDHAILWTNPHGVDEVYMLVQSEKAEVRGGRSSAGRDLSVLSIEVPVQYVVRDLTAYRLLTADGPNPNQPDAMREALLRFVASRELIEYVATLTVDEILGAARSQMAEELRRRFEARFAELGPVDPETGLPRGAGVEILFVGVSGAHPPQPEEVALSFQSVVSAEQRREATVEHARAEAVRSLSRVAGDVELANRIVAEIDALERLQNASADERATSEQELKVEELLAEAGGQAATLIAEARAARWERHMDARSVAARHAGRVALYRAAPAVYMVSQYLNAVREAARDSRLFITAFDTPHIRINLEEVQTTISGFEARESPEN